MFRGWLAADSPVAGETGCRLVVGLGNPGNKYISTRHNVGFRVIEEIVRRVSAGPSKQKFKGELFEARVSEQRLLLLCPHTFMNRSGASVLAARDFYKLDFENILVVCDDFQLPLGRLRIRKKGSSGGQKGLDDVIRRLGTQEIPRLRIGIGQPPQGWDVADYVLSKFRQDEQDELNLAIKRAGDAAEAWVREGVDACMNEYNRAPSS